MYVQLYVEQDLRWLKPLESLLFLISVSSHKSNYFEKLDTASTRKIGCNQKKSTKQKKIKFT